MKNDIWEYGFNIFYWCKPKALDKKQMAKEYISNMQLGDMARNVLISQIYSLIYSFKCKGRFFQSSVKPPHRVGEMHKQY